MSLVVALGPHIRLSCSCSLQILQNHGASIWHLTQSILDYEHEHVLLVMRKVVLENSFLVRHALRLHVLELVLVWLFFPCRNVLKPIRQHKCISHKLKPPDKHHPLVLILNRLRRKKSC